jgi:GNAT superfamily N-acetyltransferase
MLIRVATPGDAALIARHRASMFLEMNRLEEGAVSAFVAAAETCLHRMLTSGSYRGWLATDGDDSVIGGAGVLIRPLLPRPETLDAPEAIVLNVYVDPGNRRRGAARALMDEILRWCHQERIARIVLHPSEKGRPLYESMGFVPTGEMVYRGHT